jgi:hypothetical protein
VGRDTPLKTLKLCRNERSNFETLNKVNCPLCIIYRGERGEREGDIAVLELKDNLLGG